MLGAVPGSFVVQFRSGGGDRIRSIRIAEDRSVLVTGSDFAIAAAAVDRLAGDPSSALSASRFRASAILREVIASISRPAAEECCAPSRAPTRKQEVEN
jgi:hypothetical protein